MVAKEDRSAWKSGSVPAFLLGASVVGSAGAESVGISPVNSDGFTDPDGFRELQSHPILERRRHRVEEKCEGVRGKRRHLAWREYARIQMICQMLIEGSFKSQPSIGLAVDMTVPRVDLSISDHEGLK